MKADSQVLGLSSCHRGLLTRDGAPSLLEGARASDRAEKSLGKERGIQKAREKLNPGNKTRVCSERKRVEYD